VLVDNNGAGRCYQINDPVSEDNPDLLATDGGRIEIDEAKEILTLVPYRNGIVIGAKNGIWYLTGPDNGFTADAYSLTKVSERVVDSPLGAVQAEGTVYIPCESGIVALSYNQFNVIEDSDITESSIRTWYLENLQGTDCKAGYNSRQKQIWWTAGNGKTQLILDLRAQAFYPQENASSDYKVCNLFEIQGSPLYSAGYSQGGSTLYTFADLSDTQFKDFGEDQTAYLVTGYETLGKFTHKKAITYCGALFNKTETQITGYEDSQYTYDFPSGCLFQARWDFDNSNAFNKWMGVTNFGSGSGKKMQLYNPMRRGFIPSGFPWDFDTGESVIYKKIKVRGTGKAVQFKFEAEPEKDMQLLGYSVTYTMGGKF
jgi:hypothetical protein